jgi:hypothetical protein
VDEDVPDEAASATVDEGTAEEDAADEAAPEDGSAEAPAGEGLTEAAETGTEDFTEATS